MFKIVINNRMKIEADHKSDQTYTGIKHIFFRTTPNGVEGDTSNDCSYKV